MRHLDLFSGIGGFALAAKWAGLETVAFCEIDEFARKVLAKRFPGVPIYDDVTKLYRFASDCVRCPDCDEPFCTECEKHFYFCDCIGCSQFDDEVGEIDVISAGFPCQDISVGHTWRPASGLAGKRSGLWSEVVRLTNALRPKFLIAENVPALRTRGLTQCLQDLWQIGYDAEWDILSAAGVGAAHLRERIWIIAYPSGERVERVRPEGFQVPLPVEAQILSIRDSHGQWKVEPDLLRESHGVPHRMDRLKSIGNAICPQVAYGLFQAIARNKETANE